jgi:hypothetical protein
MGCLRNLSKVLAKGRKDCYLSTYLKFAAFKYAKQESVAAI